MARNKGQERPVTAMGGKLGGVVSPAGPSPAAKTSTSSSASLTNVTVTQLESHLWQAANILRGPVDAADFKTYVFPLLFFKRISDVHDEEYQAALGESH